MNKIVFFICVTLSFILYLFPEIDLQVSNAFFNPETGFYPKNHWLMSIGGFAPNILIPLTVIGVLYAGTRRYLALNSFNTDEFKDLIYFSIATLFTALLLVWAFKLGFSRIRPRYITEFMGDQQFTPAFVLNTSGNRDVSFVSGHAATGFMYMAAAFLYEGKSRFLILLGSIILGSFIGFTRIAIGSHFLSDVVVAGFLVYFGCYALSRFFNTEADR